MRCYYGCAIFLMKRFILPLTTAISAAMLACSARNSADEWQAGSNTRVCTDDWGNRVADDNCTNAVHPHFNWYYISRGGYVPQGGGTVSGGSYVPSGSAESYGTAPLTVPPGAVVRGGFGASAEAHGGFGEGAGE